jgi:hypothetical protein
VGGLLRTARATLRVPVLAASHSRPPPRGLPEKQFNGKNKKDAAKEKTALLNDCPQGKM